MSIQRLSANVSISDSKERLNIAYLQSLPEGTPKGTIVLLHGYPQTSWQYRHALPLLSAAGYRCIAPDTRGHGDSSIPADSNDYRKMTLANDVLALLSHLSITEKIHLIGHDIGGKIAVAFALQHPSHLRSLVWGENVLPGTTAYEKARSVPEQTVLLFHFILHQVSPLCEQLVEGKEKLYLEHFFDKFSYNRAAITDDVVDVYVKGYARPGAMKAAMEVYRAFDTDHKEIKEWVQSKGKIGVPSLVLNGDKSKVEAVEGMGREVHQVDKMELGLVKGSGHYIAEENPEDFVEKVLAFIGKH